MEIHGAGGLQGPQPITPRLAAQPAETTAPAATSQVPRDQVEISSLGQILEGIHRLPEIRFERVEEIRRQIAEGNYETPEKLEIALDRLLDELQG
ncbi:Anti-sigma-28 factor FlgM family protein [Isosphaera pallida ATCC 43644]|uniref:Anti-sigma-28 factor FlgM family protein n=1 Tax=Isosphaera pallida (strain ATCC 43644 / DSM 9630 / IS1B) TaxID=575540 RepID=E8QZ14_ISOPI|nr:flagellar biosynthesis anti-sigma factor FlgM [Isosphaera pallida]ADV63156.1 Anti-sigma-28 factor FlgM family protein [Isosphaera pallida ATCC 43644]